MLMPGKEVYRTNCIRFRLQYNAFAKIRHFQFFCSIELKYIQRNAKYTNVMFKESLKSSGFARGVKENTSSIKVCDKKLDI